MKNRFNALNENIEHMAKQYQRNKADISVLAVSKTKPVEAILVLYGLGHRAFGENYVQEAIEKINQTPSDIEWHFIGKIQSNKAKLIAQHFAWVQTVDSEQHARLLNDANTGECLNICIQVNISNEAQKGGVVLDELESLAAFIDSMPNLNLRGLMAMSHAGGEFAQTCEQYRQMKQCFDELQKQYPDVDTLSLGMSADLEAAIKEGSTMVRVGTALFGARD